MADRVLLNVCFRCHDIDQIAGIASSAPMDIDGLCDLAQRFLREISVRTGRNLCRKGGLFQWGIVSSGFDPMVFVQELLPFWKSLLSEEWGNSSTDPSSRILVFAEKEQLKQAEAFEIGWVNLSGCWDANERHEVSFVHHPSLPFSWNIGERCQ